MKTISLMIDGKIYSGNENQSVLDVAIENGVFIPHLCHDPRLEAYGGCRMCIVEIEGMRGMVTSCTVKIKEGMKVVTNNELLNRHRVMILKFLLASHPNECMTCNKSGDCKLQDLAYHYKIENISPLQKEERSFPLTKDNPLIELDRNKCITCGKCVRICNEVVQRDVWAFAKRGINTVVTTPMYRSMEESGCEFCGQCVSACPTGALTEKASKGKGRLSDMKRVRTTCSYCGTGCNFYLNAKDNKVVKVTSCFEGPVNQGNLCVKGRFGYEFINSPDRIMKPMIRKNGKLEEVEYQEAIDYTARKFLELKKKYGPDSLGGFSSSRCTNEENYVTAKLVRAVFGTNNIDNCARVCHAPSVAGLSACFGSGAATNSFDQIEDADVLFITGSNTTEAHPIVSLKVKKALRNGAKIIVADPRKIELAYKAEIWLDLRPGTNIALLNGMMNVILKEGLQNDKFVKDRTEGYDAFVKVVSKYTPEYAEKITGVDRNKIIEAARLYAKAEKASILYSLGMTEHNTGTLNVMSMGNLAMLCGQVGRRSTGVNPLRGQNNVQGACDMGALPNVFSGYQKVDDPAIRAKFEKFWGVKLPETKGMQSTKMIEAAHEGKLKGLFILGEDPAHTDPNISLVKESLEKLEFLVVQELFHTKTTELAHVVFPAASFAECNGTFTNGERRIQLVMKAIPPLPGRENWQTICDISTAMGYPMYYNNAFEIMEEVAAVSPMFAGITFERLKEKGLQWPIPDRKHPGTCTMYEKAFNFPSGLGKFNAIEHKDPIEMPDKEYPYTLITGRRREHYNNGSMTRRSNGIMEIWPEETLEISPSDAKKLVITDGEYVNLISRRGKVKIKARVTEKAREGRFFTSFHYIKTLTNLVTNSVFDPMAGTPEYKACAVKVEKI
ncbi:MAG: formate dehydrogenase subunit alpha [bacterium]|nr:formate dehydrogenase subunit alpha [bacterium]